MCYSACTVIFAAGTERRAHPSASFLFHGVSFYGVPPTPEVLREVARLRNHMISKIAAADADLAEVLTSSGIFDHPVGAMLTGQTLADTGGGFLRLLVGRGR